MSIIDQDLDRSKLVNEHPRGWSPERSRHDRDSHRSNGRRERDTSPINTHFGKGMRAMTEATHSKFLQQIRLKFPKFSNSEDPGFWLMEAERFLCVIK